MKATVIIPNYNGKHFLKDCLTALQRQTYKQFAIILVDNGSEDGSIEYVQDNYPDVSVIALGENTGFSGAVNAGIHASNTPYVILLNNDTKVYPGFVKALINTIDSSDKIFSVSSKMLQMSEPDYMDDAGDLYNIIGWGFQRGVAHPAKDYSKKCRVFSACAGAAIYRRSIFYEVGFFDETHFAYLEDMDIGYRARIAGYQNMYSPKALVEHVGSGTTGSRYNPLKVRLAARNSVYLNYKNMPVFQLVLNSIPLCVGYVLKYRFFKQMGFGKEFIAGLKEGLLTLSQCRKVKFNKSNLLNYCIIEWDLIKNMFIYVNEYTNRSQPSYLNRSSN